MGLELVIIPAPAGIHIGGLQGPLNNEGCYVVTPRITGAWGHITRDLLARPARAPLIGVLGVISSPGARLKIISPGPYGPCITGGPGPPGTSNIQPPGPLGPVDP